MLVMWLLGCSPSTLLVTHDQQGCSDYDFTDPPTSEVGVEVETLAVHVERSWAVADCDGRFEPEVDVDGRRIIIEEQWVIVNEPTSDDTGSGSEQTADTAGEGCQTCFHLSVTFKDPPTGRYDLTWLDTDAVSIGTVDFKVK
ncbi:MAG: hypothetical protein QGG40_22350 [Myxococcota bacterium]|jgi:hypothetical protein|nr:hypothetical protein [Myxococcota bacterium]